MEQPLVNDHLEVSFVWLEFIIVNYFIRNFYKYLREID